MPGCQWVIVFARVMLGGISMKRHFGACMISVLVMLPVQREAAAYIDAARNTDIQRHSHRVIPSPLPKTPPEPVSLPEDGSLKPAQDCGRSQEISGLLKKYDHAIKRYLRIKTRSVLEKNIPRIRDGMTLSQFFSDYHGSRIIIRTLDGREIEVKDFSIQKNYYIWKEGDVIVMGADVMLMSEKAKDELVRRISRKAGSRWAPSEYYRVAEKTKRVGSSTPFALDCKHAAELDGLVRNAVRDLMAKEDTRIISPQVFDRLLTVLRAYITFNYYQKLSHEDFDRRFRKLGTKIGRGFWSHQKLTRLLGLHVLGRIESNRAFRKTYAKAISRAARKAPHIPRKWIEEIIWIETKGDPMTISRAGAYGLMQLMPLVYMGMGEKKARRFPLAFESTINPFNPETNIERGVAFLAKLHRLLKPHMRRYSRAVQKKILFHAYNTGPTRVISLLKKYGLGYVRYLPGETKAYLGKLADFPHN